LLDDPGIERLELAPTGGVLTDLHRRLLGHLVVYEHGVAGCLGEKLGLTGPLHRDEPPRGLVDRTPDREDPVVGQNRGLIVAQSVGDSCALFVVEHHAGVVIKDRMVAVERTGILGQGIERSAKRGPRLAVE